MKTPSRLQFWIENHTGCTDQSSLTQWQIKKIRQALAYAKENSRFYREHLKDIDPDTINSLRDLDVIPLTDPQLLRSAPQDWLCCSQTEVSRIVTLKTSGTTDQPKRIFFSQEDQEQTIDFFAHGMRELVNSGDRVMVLMPCSQPGSVGDLLAKGLERIGVSVLPAGPVSHIQSTYDLLRNDPCQCIVGIPNQVLALAQYSVLLPKEERIPIKNVLLSADATPPALIKKISDLMDCQVFTHFGMTEMGLGGAVECSAHQGCHIRENHLFVEVVDPETGAPLPDGTPGEFVFTSLDRRAMPFIRYRTGDRGVLLTQPCPCGSYIRRMLPLGGRLTPAPLSLWALDEILIPLPHVVDYTLTYQEGSFHLELLGLLPPDPEEAKARLSREIFPYPFTVSSRVISGFTGTGMQKRSIHYP